jgi:hypothetical protein
MNYEHFIFRRGGGTGINMGRDKLVWILWNATRKNIKVTPHDHGMFYLRFWANLAVLASLVQGGFITLHSG